MNLTMGGVSGCLAVTVSYPTDLVRRYMQLSGTKGYPQYNNMFEVFAHVVRQDGLLGLYKGYFACILKVGPAIAILFWCNELLKTYVIPQATQSSK